MVRKSLHFLVALVPVIASYHRSLAYFLLATGSIVYLCAETLRFSGIKIPVISEITVLASRERDKGRFVFGPLTLAIGAMLSLFLFPEPYATIAIYALAFGDGLASVVGKFLGKTRPAMLNGKSVEGSTACFVAVFIVTLRVVSDVRIAFWAALLATAIEAMPLEDYDNIAIPVTVGLFLTLI